MKLTFLKFLSLSLLLISCGGNKKKSVEDTIASKNLEEIQELRSSLKTEQSELNDKLTRLDAAIKKLDQSDNAALITVKQVSDTLFNHYVELQGNVSTKKNVIVYPEMQGVLQRVYVKEGDNVRKGQLLATIDDGGLSSQVAQVETQAALAKTTFERQKALWEQQIGSEIQYLQAKSNYEAAQNQVNQMKSMLGKTSVRAPFSGVVDDVITEQGTVVAPGSQLFRIVNLDDMYIKADVPERYIKDIQPGKEVIVNLPILGEQIKTKVRQTSNYINPSNRTFSIEVAVPNKKGLIKPNLTARLKINDYTKEDAILIPLNIISENADGEQFVYLVQQDSTNSDVNIANRKIISTGKSQQDFIEVTNGLASGDKIIVEGARSVKDGQEVSIVEY
ncbi:efflux RND transporter periplasmic adaptor subunit [Gangjinia marincola]|uniref:Efflux RND transporter periplasmic adaptor subunit n=1 Tax=Gangjinia marincola TaxID=578463 RepID=A0ABP3XT68_9FLAO